MWSVIRQRYGDACASFPPSARKPRRVYKPTPSQPPPNSERARNLGEETRTMGRRWPIFRPGSGAGKLADNLCVHTFPLVCRQYTRKCVSPLPSRVSTSIHGVSDLIQAGRPIEGGRIEPRKGFWEYKIQIHLPKDDRPLAQPGAEALSNMQMAGHSKVGE